MDLTVYASPFEKTRLGRDHDGGYIIARIPNIEYDVLISGGIENDISFEEDFMKMYPGVKAYLVDGTIDALPPGQGEYTFIHKNIGFVNEEAVTNLHDIIAQYNRIFVKMDIEGGEIPWVKSLSSEQLDKFEQIVMEFHFPFSETEVKVFEKLREHHHLIHFHGNNCCGVRMHNGVIVPNVFECTFLHKKYNILGLNAETIPGVLDSRNVLAHPDIYIDYPPFVHTLKS